MVLYMITMISLISSSDALWNISSTNQTVTNMSTTNTLMISTLNSTAYYNTRPKSLKDKIATYTIKPPYLYIFIAVLSLIVIGSIVCCIVSCIVLYRNRNIKRRVSEPPKPIGFEFALTGHSLGKSKKHSINLKIWPASVPNNSTGEPEQGSDEDQPEEEEMSTEEHETCSEEEQKEETNKTVVHNDYAYDNTLNVPETLELQNVNTLEMQNQNFMSFSEREYENEWYDPTFTVDNFGKSIDDESVTEHLRKEFDAKLQNTNRHELKQLSQVLEVIKDDERYEYDETNKQIQDHDSADNSDGVDEYHWIVKTLKKIDRNNGQTLIKIFKQNLVTDDRLKDLREEDWAHLIKPIGTRNAFRKLYEIRYD